LAVGRGYEDCTPVKGVFKGNEKQKMSVSVRLDTTPNKNNEVQISEDILDFTESKSETTKNTYRKQLEIIQQQQ
jgi:hypothetical protein